MGLLSSSSPNGRRVRRRGAAGKRREAVLFVGAGIESLPGIAEARAMGLAVAATDGDPHAPGLARADAARVASTYDIEATLAAAGSIAREVPVRGVLSVGCDVPLTVAVVARELGLPGLSLRAARAAADKMLMKRRLAAAGIPVPWFGEVRSALALWRVVRERGLPLVVKPVDGRGARGVVRLVEGVDVAWAFATARAASRSGRVMVEQYVAGPQVSTESVLWDDWAETPGFSDRNYALLERFAPYMVEDGGELPSRLPAGVRRRVARLAEAAGRALGVRRGTVKGDLVVGKGGPVVIEVAPRLSGGYFCSHETPLATGVNLLRAAIEIALGREPDRRLLVPRCERAVAQRWIFPPRAGRVVRVRGLRRARRLPGIALLELRVRPGQQVGEVTSHPARAGVVIAEGPTVDRAVGRAERAVAAIEIDVAEDGCA